MTGLEVVQRLLKAVGVRALSLGQGLEPVRYFVEALFAGALRHARVHVGVLMGLAGDRRLEVQRGGADGEPRRGIAARLQILEVTVRVARLAFGSRAKYRRYIVEALDVRLGCKVQIAAIGLRFAGKRVLSDSFPSYCL